MRLPGQLEETTLEHMLGALRRRRATGTLDVIEPAARSGEVIHRVHVREGLVVNVQTPETVQRLGEILRRDGYLGPRGAELFERIANGPSDRPMGQRLMEARLVTPSGVARALRAQVQQRLDRLHSIQDARLAFRPAGPTPPPRDARESPRPPALVTLGLPAGASRDDVRRAFRRLAADLHPDRHPGASESERAAFVRRFSELSAAYHALVA